MRARLTIAAGLLGLPAVVGISRADEPKKEPAVITAWEPASLVTGGKVTLKLRGFQLKDATELRFPKAPGVKAEIKERKDAPTVNGLENKQVGDAQLQVDLTLPADLPAGTLEYVIATPTGDAAGRIPVVTAGTAIEEKEPNNGFRTAQKLEPAKAARGAFQQDKDVDVYVFAATAGQKLKVTVTGGSSLLMDAALTCYDDRLQPLASADDSEGRDPALTFTAPAAGPVYLCVSDAHDKGGEWHSYLLRVEEGK